MKAILKINDKEIEVEVSAEQIKKLTKRESPFARAEEGEFFWCINEKGNVVRTWRETHEDCFGKDRYEVANYCLDYNLIQQQAWRETLNRLLWRWQYENDESCDWSDFDKAKYCIRYNYEDSKFILDYNEFCKSQGRVYFTTAKKAEQAIEEIVKPFMAEHPDFVW